MHPGLVSWGERLLASGIYGGLGLIGLSLIAGLGALVLQLIAFARNGIWDKYTLLDLARATGWQLPLSISDSADIDYLWATFLREGSLALTFLFYVPLVILLIGFTLWQLLAHVRLRGRED